MASENSSFAIDWKMAVLGALVIVGLVVTVVTAALEGMPWETRTEAAARDKVYDARLETLQSTQTTNATQLSATGAQLAALGIQVATLAQKQSDDHDTLQKMQTDKRMNSLKQELRQKQLAEKLNRQHYEKEMEVLEHSRAVGL